MKRSFKYEYEVTPVRKFYDVVENVVNHALLFTFSGIVLSGVVIAVINLV
jgi:hypothetical protein